MDTLNALPIGVFDSGVGGLTVLEALRQRLPGEDLLYLGDTARLPYGAKSPETVARYARQAARALVAHGVKMLVVACNTASALALDALRHEFDHITVIGVIGPGAAAACTASRNGRIAVIATESTVRGGAYPRAIHALRPQAEVVSQPCPLFVALAEEGWTDDPIAEAVARRYLTPLFEASPDHRRADTLVLGCTHFPVLRPVIERVVGPDVVVVDSAATTAARVEQALGGLGLLRKNERGGQARFLATDAPERFALAAARFLSDGMAPAGVEWVDL